MLAVIEALGWIGSFLLIAAYVWNSFGELSSQSKTYQLMNLLGGVFLIINTIYLGAYPSSFLNLVWAIIAGIYLLKIRKENKEVETVSM